MVYSHSVTKSVLKSSLKPIGFGVQIGLREKVIELYSVIFVGSLKLSEEHVKREEFLMVNTYLEIVHIYRCKSVVVQVKVLQFRKSVKYIFIYTEQRIVT